jgi:hypothetical protein
MTTIQEMRDFVAGEKAKAARHRRIVHYLRVEISPKSVAAIIEMFPESNAEELAAMAQLRLITYIRPGKYTAFK